MRSLRLFPILVWFAVNAVANAVPSTIPSAPASREEVRKQLAAFFANGGIGDLKKSPGAHEAVQKRIGAMTYEELSHFQKLIAETPNWRTLPQAVSAAIPPEVRKSVEGAAADLAARVPEAERMRDDVRTLTTVLRLLPDEKLKELGIDRGMLGSLDGVLADLSPLQGAMLQRQLADVGTWNEKSAKAIAALPPELRRGALALAKHGPLTDDDRKSLEPFRTELTGLLRTVQALSPSTIPSVDAKQLQNRIDYISLATPEVLFMIREQWPPEKMAELRENVAVLDRAAHLSESERAALETFRAEVAETFSQLQPEATPGDLRDKIAQLQPEQLARLQEKLAAVPEWKETLPLYYRTFSAPGLATRIAAVSGPASDPARVAELQAFRAQALQYIEAAAGDEGVDAALVQKASNVVANADPVRLELIRSLAAEMGGMSPHGRLKVISNFSCPTIDFEFVEVNFNFICNPLEDIMGKVNEARTDINRVDDHVLHVNENINVIDGVVDEVKATVNEIASKATLVDNHIVHVNETVNEIAGALDDIPDLAWETISGALDDFLDVNIRSGLDLRQILELDYQDAVTTMRGAFHLTGDWWLSLPNVTFPSLSCPTEGMTPFGEIGTDEAVAKFDRYNFFFEELEELIPDTEFSLAIKIPAQIAHAMLGFTGVCLQEAADKMNRELLTIRHTSLTNDIGNLSSQVTTTTGNLSSQVATTTGNLSSQVATITGNLSSQVATTTSALSVQLTNSYNNLIAHGNGQTTSLTASIAATEAALSNQLTAATTALTNKIDAEAQAQRSLDLRLQIEMNLYADHALAMFQLPEIQGGYLELVRDTVNNAMTSMLAAGQSINQAQRYYNDAQTEISQSRYKDAFKSLQNAYSELTK